MRAPYACPIMSEDGLRCLHEFDGWLDVEHDRDGWSVEGVFAGDRYDTHNMFLGSRLEQAIADAVEAIAMAEIKAHGKLAGFLADETLMAAE